MGSGGPAGEEGSWRQTCGEGLSAMTGLSPLLTMALGHFHSGVGHLGGSVG